MGHFGFDEEAKTAEYVGQTSNVSGVHSASTRPAPYIEELERKGLLIGSISASELSVDFQPIANLLTGETRGYEVLPRSRCEGLTNPEELFARATFEKTVGELGRALRAIAIRECAGAALFIPVHPGELKDRFLVRPDDPICEHDAQVFLQLSQPLFTELGRVMVAELGCRAGVTLVFDDLGAGPTTLQQLAELEPGAVKLDASLLADIEQSPRKQTVVRSIVAMCEQLGAQVIAKGIDREPELQAAIDCGVVYGQGAVLGGPAPLPIISAWPPSG
ncbi:MAG: EAL domain-containing protein [Polyangiales bacterium]